MAGRLSAGALRHRIGIRRPVLVDDGKGGQVREWQTVARLAAQVEGMDGRESIIAHALQGISVFRITVRRYDGLLPSDQVRLPDGRDLNITSIADPDGRRVQLMILATTASAMADAGGI